MFPYATSSAIPGAPPATAKNTIVKLLLDLAPAVARYQDETLRNLPCKRLQCDEIWAFVGGKDKNLSTPSKASYRLAARRAVEPVGSPRESTARRHRGCWRGTGAPEGGRVC
jgi:hypothetical protein